MTWVQFPGPLCWEERTNACQVSSDFHVCTRIWTYAHKMDKNVIQKNPKH